jgi:hypothetical protein
MPYGTAFFAAGFEKRSGGYYDTPDALVSSGGSFFESLIKKG